MWWWLSVLPMAFILLHIIVWVGLAVTMRKGNLVSWVSCDYVLINTHFDFLIFCKVTVRCGCQTLKKEWLCQDVQAAHVSGGCDPKEIPKNQFGVGLLPCGSDCKSKVKVPDSELHLRQVQPLEVMLCILATNVLTSTSLINQYMLSSWISFIIV